MQWVVRVLALYQASFIENEAALSMEALARVHAPSYLQGLRDLAQCEHGHTRVRLDPELVFDGAMWRAACAAAAAVAAISHTARVGELNLCLSRPGSHHAGRDYALGGCVLNSLAVAATNALAEGHERVAIIDFDAHHGNGTQDIFINNKRVLTTSLHQHPFFPGSGSSKENTATNLNFTLAAESGEAEAIEAYAQALAAVEAYAPTFVLFEAGVDAHALDSTSDLKWENSTYKKIGEMTKSALARLRAPCVFELGGGYSQEAIEGGFMALLDGLGAVRGG
jgi:acetoin utilization deacetylase AcuC-like enzyme